LLLPFAALPQFIETWSLTNTQAGWLAGIVSAGYMLAVVPLVMVVPAALLSCPRLSSFLDEKPDDRKRCHGIDPPGADRELREQANHDNKGYGSR
jgi:hypothetical protein